MIRASVRVCVLAVLLVVQGVAVRGAETLDQTTRLAALGRVWGFLKYYSPRVAEGQVDWDAALVRAIPRVQKAQTKDELNRELLLLVRAADARLQIPAGVDWNQTETLTALKWLDDPRVLQPVTRQILKGFRYSKVPTPNKYVKPAAPVNNPDFSGEAPYSSPSYPTEPYRLLALFRYWNIVNYYSPNRDITERPWHEVLDAFVPQFVAAKDAVEYHLALAELTASLSDSHGIANSSVLTNYWGTNSAPIRVRHVESQTVVTKVLTRFTLGADVRVGDIVSDINGVPSATRRNEIAKYVGASNPPTLHRNLNSLILRTPASTIRLGIVRDGVRREVVLACATNAQVAEEDAATEDHTVSRILPGNLGYVHMGWLERSQVAGVMTALMNTRAIILDVRNYPQSTFPLVSQYLMPEQLEFVRFTEPRYSAPGDVEWRSTILPTTNPITTQYRGQVILLFDERTQSHAEYTIMALQVAPNTTLIGSQTAGADGNVSQVSLPGGFSTLITGLGVYYPDGTPTQRIGIVPHHEVRPTVAGIRAGVDELLEYALALVR